MATNVYIFIFCQRFAIFLSLDSSLFVSKMIHICDYQLPAEGHSESCSFEYVYDWVRDSFRQL